MKTLRNQKLEKKYIDISNIAVVNCIFKNCTIKGANYNNEEDMFLLNCVFENCNFLTESVHLSNMQLSFPTKFINTKVNLIGDFKKFFRVQNRLEKDINYDDVNFIEQYFNGCTINGISLEEELRTHYIQPSVFQSFKR